MYGEEIHRKYSLRQEVARAQSKKNKEKKCNEKRKKILGYLLSDEDCGGKRRKEEKDAVFSNSFRNYVREYDHWNLRFAHG